MKVNAISSTANSLLKRVRALHQRSNREKVGQFILEGPKLVEEALVKRLDLKDVILSRSYYAEGLSRELAEQLEMSTVAVSVVDDRLFSDLVTTTTPCGIMAVANKKSYGLSDCLKGEDTLIVVGESLQDPGNLGTMVRNCLAFGATGLILTKGTVDPYNPKVVRSAMGALFSIPIVTDAEVLPLIDELQQANVKVVALDASAPEPFWNLALKEPVAFIFGNEGNGLSAATLERAGSAASIPIASQTESLNVSVASAIVLCECARVRNFQS